MVTLIIYHLKNAVILYTLLIFSLAANTYAQEKRTKYNILRNGNIIGQMQFCQKNDGDDLYLKMTSQVKTQFIMSINVNIEEDAHFKNGKLISSKVVRHVNGKKKANNQTMFINNVYQTQSDDKISQIRESINYNLMLLYTNEPINLSQVYSDNYLQFLKIKQTEPHTYRIILPDGNYNDYYFIKGICQQVIVHHSLYTIKIQLA
ncbi:hypothetical protein HDF26_005018 [Pedobacter cryoconitis]|uniref:Uncharacterized protein n=1 Tax=Pedobacter cryoconitis TaxID=188932 RepID=A0A7W8ZLU5_9SPHI|nr:DUF6134 family protein [Pedobacter cryoconitis]MBB5636404.1 hypothetical protein [Pedobacter cryoconitis]MBB6274540.1 hypothetical protein [Pedobacter cryoconitis]